MEDTQPSADNSRVRIAQGLAWLALALGFICGAAALLAGPDFVVHEAAHIFHNCKRSTIGLSGTARREWLLEIAYSKRETFAYSCETYSRILELGKGSAVRRDLLKEVEDGPMPPDDRVDAQEYLDILREAVEAGNGWKRILRRCAAEKVQRGRAIGEP